MKERKGVLSPESGHDFFAEDEKSETDNNDHTKDNKIGHRQGFFDLISGEGLFRRREITGNGPHGSRSFFLDGLEGGRQKRVLLNRCSFLGEIDVQGLNGAEAQGEKSLELHLLIRGNFLAINGDAVDASEVGHKKLTIDEVNLTVLTGDGLVRDDDITLTGAADYATRFINFKVQLITGDKDDVQNHKIIIISPGQFTIIIKLDFVIPNRRKTEVP